MKVMKRLMRVMAVFGLLLLPFASAYGYTQKSITISISGSNVITCSPKQSNVIGSNDGDLGTFDKDGGCIQLTVDNKYYTSSFTGSYDLYCYGDNVTSKMLVSSSSTIQKASNSTLILT